MPIHPLSSAARRVLVLALLTACAPGRGTPGRSASPPPTLEPPVLVSPVVAPGALSAFESDDSLSRYLGALAAERRRIAEEAAARWRAMVKSGEIQPGAACAAARIVARDVARADTASSGTRRAVLEGRVRDALGSPIPDAQVALDDLGATTSGSGAFRLELSGDRLPAEGPLDLVVRRIGYRLVRDTIRLAPGDSATVDVRLCEAVAMLQASVAAAAPAPAMAQESITNTQHAGVDEGGIVKLHGDHLIVLRRGRLFTIAVGDGALRPVHAVDAFAPGIDPDWDWYDELLVSGNRVVVVGYSYARGGTEIGIFRIDERGRLRHEDTYHLRSHDYYSSRNYASRLVGSTLVFYSPLILPLESGDVAAVLPAMRRWRRGATEADFRPIATSRRVHHPARPLDPAGDVALHTVTTCDLAADELSCTARSVIGPASRVFYVSPTAVYVWTSGSRRAGSPLLASRDSSDGSAVVYRLPLDGSAPTALGARGGPVDQFSFLEEEGGTLDVLLRGGARGEWMWSAERSDGDVALLRVPIAAFGDGSADAPAGAYRPLPAPPPARHGTFHNRFVGGHLLYGVGNGWWHPQDASSELRVVPLRGGDITTIELSHGTDRIEAMGEDAVVVGVSGGSVHFSGIRLDSRPRVVQHFELARASQGEQRSHGFFYRADGVRSGVLGLPVMGPGRPGYAHLFDESASIVYLRNTGSDFEALGALEPGTGRVADDGCRASCVDWYGDARPILLRGRVFALLGYEIVEGRIAGGRIREVRRASFAPRR